MFRNTRVLLLQFISSSNKKSPDVLVKSAQIISKRDFKFTPLYSLSGVCFLKNSTQKPFFQ